MNDELRITINSALHRYIEHYAKKANLNPVQGCLKVISDVERVLGLILTKN